MRESPDKEQSARHRGVRLGTPGGFFGKLIALVVFVLVLALFFAFSLVLLVIATVAGVIVWGYFKYRTYLLRQAYARGEAASPSPDPFAAPAAGADRQGLIIEGEASREAAPDALPTDPPADPADPTDRPR